jgi:spore maturation protein CgeB
MAMKIVYFTHSLASCWNHGNAHFLRGLLRELRELGHFVTAYEPANGWSRRNLIADHGEVQFRRFHARFPELEVKLYGDDPDVEALLQGAQLAIVHEWTDPDLAARIGSARKRSRGLVLLFHDTHHRAISDPAAMARFDLSGYDGVLAFGQSLAEVYRRAGWGRRVFVLHEAADTRLFHPPAEEHAADRKGIVWIGNWGDEERTQEIISYLLRPARDLTLPLDVYGVRYPHGALRALSEHQASYHGWIANCDVPSVFAHHRATVHVARRFYSALLPGIPTIRVFEALACGIPLICAPWSDSEGLFRPGTDYLLAHTEDEMRRHMRGVISDMGLWASVAHNGLASIRSRHTCAHRARELLGIAAGMMPQLAGAA